MPPTQKPRVNAEQDVFLYQICPRYHKARQDRTLDKFWPPIWDHWFLSWPVVPGLIERGALPPEAANYKFTPEQKKVVNAEMELILEVCIVPDLRYPSADRVGYSDDHRGFGRKAREVVGSETCRGGHEGVGEDQEGAVVPLTGCCLLAMRVVGL